MHTVDYKHGERMKLMNENSEDHIVFDTNTVVHYSCGCTVALEKIPHTVLLLYCPILYSTFHHAKLKMVKRIKPVDIFARENILRAE